MKKTSRYIIICIFALFLLGIFLSNVIGRKEGFWGASITDWLELCMLLVVSYYLVCRESAINRKKEKIEYIISEIKRKILDKELLSAGSDVEKSISRLKLSSISNLIKYVKDYVEDEELKKKIEYIENKNNELKALFIDHIDDAVYIEKSQSDFYRFITNISDKLDEINLDLDKL